MALCPAVLENEMSQSLSASALQACKPVSLIPHTVPPPPSRLLPRPHLVAQLLEKPQRLRLLCAPAGYGKSALIKECLLPAGAMQRCVQLKLAGQPLTLSQFCARVAEQLGDLAQGVDSGPALLDLLEGLNEPCTLILDDYPARADTELDAWLDHLLLHSPAQVQLWVSCRRRPAWNLPRLLLDGELLELDSRALAFSRREFDALVSVLTPTTAATTREEIWRQTLGWCAGARLLLAAEDNSPHIGSLLLRDYLERELLSHLSANERRLFQGLAHLPRFSESLCGQLREELDEKALVRKWLQSQAFLEPLDGKGEWYRMLPAVAQALQAGADAGELKRLRLSACRELSALGFIEDAIDLALSTGHADVAVNYMASLNPSWLLAGRNLQHLIGWRQQLPEGLLEGTAYLVVLNATAYLISSRLDEAQRCLAQLSRFLPQPTATLNRRVLAIWQALHGATQGLLGHCAIAREHCQEALDHLGEDERHVSFVCTVTLARLAMSNGETVQAQQILMGAIEQARRQGCLVREVQVNTQRICLMILCGESDLARLLLQENLSLLQADGSRHPMLLGRLQVLQGKLHLQRGELDACENVLRQALQHVAELSLPVLYALTGLAEVCACRGDFQQAFTLLQDAERRMQCANVQESSYRAVLNLQTLSVLIHQKNWKQALPMAHMIEQYLRGSTARLTSLQVPSLPVHSQVLLALVEQGVGQVKEASRRLQTVLRECQRLNFHGLQMKVQRALDNLTRNPGQLPQPASAAGSFNLLVSEARSAQPSNPDLRSGVSLKKSETLSGREVAVLELLAEGLSNREISERLFISTNTVKAHIKHINAKLGVTRRAQAVMRARATGVLV